MSFVHWEIIFQQQLMLKIKLKICIVDRPDFFPPTLFTPYFFYVVLATEFDIVFRNDFYNET